MTTLDKPAAGRSCGSCTLCCKVFGIDEIAKPIDKWCPHCEIGKGCRIYDTRPQECRTFHCLWLADGQMADHWKPERSKLVVMPGGVGPGGNEHSLEIRCDHGHPGAWRKEPYYSELMQLAKKVRAANGTIIVIVGQNGTLLAPEGEFPLGKLDPDQRIVLRFHGTRLIKAWLVHKDEMNKPAK